MEARGPVIVAGGGGFIGRALCRALMASGRQVMALTRGPSREPSMTPSGPLPAFANWDGRTAKGWEHLADGAYALVNLAGESIGEGRWSPERKKAIVESRLLAGQAMTQAVAAAKVKPRVFVQASAVGYYGHREGEAVDESSPPGEGFLAELCVRWEESTRAVEDMGARRVILRTGLVLGRDGGALTKMLTPYKLFLGGPFGDGGQGFPWIHIEDEARAALFLMERADASGPFNLTAPEGVTNLQFCRHLGRALKRPCGLAVPAGALRLVFGEMARELLLSGALAFPRRLMEMGFEFKHPRLGEALAGLLSGPPPVK
jgi:hypothetical protein